MAKAPSAAGPTSPELRTQFWLLVGVLNVAILATTLGVLVLAFWSRPLVGIGLLTLGVGAAVFAWRRYRRLRANLSDAG